MNFNAISMEALAYDQIRNKNSDSVILDYTSYFADAYKCMKSIEVMNAGVYEQLRSVNKLQSIYKNSMIHSREDETEDLLAKNKSFGSKVKMFFAKIWAAIVSVFQRIVLTVVSLIKTLIIYIQKKRLSNQVVIKKCKDVLAKIGANNANAALNELFVSLAKTKVRVFDIDPDNRHETADYLTVHNAINNPSLKTFVKWNAEYDGNQKSIFNLENLEQATKYDVYFRHKFESNMDQNGAIEGFNKNDLFMRLEIDVNSLATQAILGLHLEDKTSGASFSGVTDTFNAMIYGNDINSKNDNDAYTDLSESGNIKKFANYITYGTESDKAKYTSIPIREYLNLGDENGPDANRPYILNTIVQAVKMYENDFALVCGKGGYLESIESAITKFKNIAAKDAATSKKIKDFVDSMLKSIEAGIVEQNSISGNNEKFYVLQGELKRFTKIITKINTVKAKFIALRQYVIGNIISMLSSEESVVRCVGKCVDKNHYDQIDLSIDKNNSVDTGIKDLEITDDDDDLYTEGDEDLHDGINAIDDKITEKMQPVGGAIENIDKKADTAIDTVHDKFDSGIDKIANFLSGVADKVQGSGDEDEENYDNEEDYSYDNDDF